MELPPELGLSVSNGQIQFPDSTCALCLKDGAILVVLQDRSRSALTLELPGGKVDAGESPVTSALRELEEEAGVAAESGELILTLDLDLSVSVHRTHLVGVTGAIKMKSKGDFPTRWLPVEEGLRMVYQGAITHAPTVTAILLKHLERQADAGDHT
jgi:ADP-ribose diphosphatase